MGYYNSGTSAHRNSFYAAGSDYNRMMMQAEMTAEAFASRNPNIDVKAFTQANADAIQSAFRNVMREERERAERAEQERLWNIRCAEARRTQQDNLQILEEIIYGNTLKVANVPENRIEALAVCDYIKKNNAYPAPWGHAKLTAAYRNLVQAFLDRKSDSEIVSLTKMCVNTWIAECRILRINVAIYNPVKWCKTFDELVTLQN